MKCNEHNLAQHSSAWADLSLKLAQVLNYGSSVTAPCPLCILENIAFPNPIVQDMSEDVLEAYCVLQDAQDAYQEMVPSTNDTIKQDIIDGVIDEWGSSDPDDILEGDVIEAKAINSSDTPF